MLEGVTVVRIIKEFHLVITNGVNMTGLVENVVVVATATHVRRESAVYPVA